MIFLQKKVAEYMLFITIICVIKLCWFPPSGMDVQFEQNPSSVEALVGEGVTLVCRPPASIPPALVTWYKDVEVVPVRLETKYRLHYVDARNGIWDLRFQNVLSSDDGEYYCVAYNNFSLPKTRTSHIAKLTVTGIPCRYSYCSSRMWIHV